MNSVSWMQSRLAGRPDSEHQQAFVRIVILTLVAGYLWFAIRPQGDVVREFQLSFAFLGVEFAIGLSIIIWMLVRPAPSNPRRLLGMMADYSLMGIGMYLLGEMLAPLYVLLMWVTIGNGLRYGPRWLYVAIAMASVTFLAVILSTPYWQQNPWVGWGLLAGLVAIPLYFSSLLKALTRATEEARAASAAKSRFVATMSHELRTPLNGIIGMAELLHTTPMSSEQQDSAKVILTSARALQLLVEDVLDISAIEAGKLQRHDSDFDLVELLDGIRVMLLPAVQAKQLDFRMKVPSDLPRNLHGDSAHLRQILVNLLSNAVKFTPAGSVQLEITVLSRDRDDLQLRFDVSDTGIGIPTEAQGRIFRMFEQADSGRDRRYGGSGLGTTIARALSELLGGHIELSSTEGIGSMFRVEVPMRVANAAIEVPKKVALGNVIAFDDPFLRHRARIQPKQIMVVDDQEANVLVVRRLLEKAGHHVRWAGHADAVLDALDTDRIDLVITDLHMPGVNGIELLKQARWLQAGRTKKTPFIVLTADATSEAEGESVQAGAHAVLYKPVVVAKLLEAIIAATGPTTSPTKADDGKIVRPVAISHDMVEDLRQMGLGEEFVRSFLQECIQDARRCMREIRRTAEAELWDECRDAHHALKGAAGNMGALQLSAQAEDGMRASNHDLRISWQRRLTSMEQGLAEAMTALAARQIILRSDDAKE